LYTTQTTTPTPLRIYYIRNPVTPTGIPITSPRKYPELELEIVGISIQS
jgi:hypothetical protein